jgi:hypothetical protein
VAAHLDRCRPGPVCCAESLARRSGPRHNLPAYVIFHDATLAPLRRWSPQSLEDLQGVSGIGAKKLEAYGLKCCGWYHFDSYLRHEGLEPDLLHKAHAAGLAHLGLDAVLGFQLVQELLPR